MFENGKPDIVMKTVKGFNIKRTTFIILMTENNFNWELLSSSCWLQFLISTFTLDPDRDSKNPVFKKQTLIVRIVPSVSFRNNVPCNVFIKYLYFQALADNEAQIMKDLIDCQGPPCDVGGYFKLDEAKAILKIYSVNYELFYIDTC